MPYYVLLLLVITNLNYKYVEKKFLNKSTKANTLLLPLILILAIAAIGLSNDGYKFRYSNQSEDILQYQDNRTNSLSLQGESCWERKKIERICEFDRSSNNSVYNFGDSHAGVLSLFLSTSNDLKQYNYFDITGCIKYIENINIKLSLSDVGDRYVVEKMKDTNSFLGGEPSGHIIFSDNSYCGDGILTALYILGILEEEKITLSDLCDLLFIKTPQRLLNFKLTNNNQNLINSQKVEKLINKYEDKDCEIILRKSGTENVLRLMIQSSEEGDIDDFIKLFSNIINE